MIHHLLYVLLYCPHDRFVVLQDDAKKKFEDLTLELVGRYSPQDKAAETLERLKMKAAKAWPNVSPSRFL